MEVADRGNGEHARSLAQHCGRDFGAGVQLFALEAPCDGDWHVSLGDDAQQLRIDPGVHYCRSKGERNYHWWF